LRAARLALAGLAARLTRLSLLPGLAAGTLLYAGTLLASRALDWRELKPLLRKP